MNLKELLTIPILFLASANAFASPAATTVSVTRFEEEASHIIDSCHSWDFGHQGQLQTTLEHELRLQGLRVLERKEIRRVYENEFELPNLNQKSVSKRKQFLAAKFTITGGITELGICEDSSKSGVQLGGVIGLLGGPSMDLEAKKKSSTSTIKLVAKIVSGPRP